MNDKNNALFFNEDNDFNAVITLTDEEDVYKRQPFWLP